MSLQAVTFDFWSTLVSGKPVAGRHARRMARVVERIVSAGHACTAEELDAAFRRALQRVGEAAKESLVDIGPPGRWAAIASELGIPDGLIAHEVLEEAYEDLAHDATPPALPHVHAAVSAMKARGYKLGVICNTGMAGGKVLREVLRKHGLLDYFDVTVFSNEFGLSKPHPEIFEHTLRELGGVPPGEALHVGDLEELDVDGALGAGMYAALYVGETQQSGSSRAQLIVSDWRDFASQLAGLAENGDPAPDPGSTIARRRD